MMEYRGQVDERQRSWPYPELYPRPAGKLQEGLTVIEGTGEHPDPAQIVELRHGRPADGSDTVQAEGKAAYRLLSLFIPLPITKYPVVGAILIVYIELQSERLGKVVLPICAHNKIGHVMIKRMTARGLIYEYFSQAKGPAGKEPEGLFLFLLGTGRQGDQGQQRDEKHTFHSDTSFFATGVN